jgi:FlaA1/EpsC-like NDP-sugar epimerase
MGEPVRIADLAEELIRLFRVGSLTKTSTCSYRLRPGEKLYEELLIEGEGIKPTRHEKIRLSQPLKQI